MRPSSRTTRHDPGIDLSTSRSIPNSPSFIEVNVHCQSATFSSGFHALGVIAGNGLTLVLDAL